MHTPPKKKKKKKKVPHGHFLLAVPRHTDYLWPTCQVVMLVHVPEYDVGRVHGIHDNDHHMTDSVEEDSQLQRLEGRRRREGGGREGVRRKRREGGRRRKREGEGSSIQTLSAFTSTYQDFQVGLWQHA